MINSTNAEQDPATAPIPQDGRQGTLAKATSGFVKHPVWISVGALIGVIGVVVSVIQIFYKPGTGGPDLEVAVVDIQEPEDAEGTALNAARQPLVQPSVMGVTPIDITLKNSGGEPATISQAVATVRMVRYLPDCVTTGVLPIPPIPSPTAPVLITGLYALEFPADSSDGASGTKDLQFELKAGAVDRLLLTIGPSEEMIDTNDSRAFAVDITLVPEGSVEPLQVGTVSFVTAPAAVERQIKEANSRDCALSNLERLEEIYAVEGIRSDALERLRGKYQQVAESA